MSSSYDLNLPPVFSEMFLMMSIWEWLRTGCWTSILTGGFRLKLLSRLGFGPMKETSDMTMSSRIGSIGGLVTCAKSWRKYW